MLRYLPAVRETCIRSLGWEDPLEKGMATHSNILAWRMPWIEATVHGIRESDTAEQLTLSHFHCINVHILNNVFFDKNNIDFGR